MQLLVTGVFSWRSEITSGLEKIVAVGEALAAAPPELAEDLKEYLAWSSGCIANLLELFRVRDCHFLIGWLMINRGVCLPL